MTSCCYNPWRPQNIYQVFEWRALWYIDNAFVQFGDGKKEYQVIKDGKFTRCHKKVQKRIDKMEDANNNIEVFNFGDRTLFIGFKGEESKKKG